MNIFEQAKSALDIIDVASFYGIDVKKNKAICPFHNDKHPSMSFKNERFKCFVCGAGGDALEFVGKLLNISPIEAVKQLNSDFNLQLDIDGRTPNYKAVSEHKRQQNKLADFESLEKQVFCEVSTRFKQLRQYRTDFAPKKSDESLHPLFIESLQHLVYTEYLCDLLIFGTFEEKALICKNFARKEKADDKFGKDGDFR